jgi:hypothetical protein
MAGKVPNPRGYNKDQMDAYNYSKAGRYMGPNGPFEVGKKGKNPFNGDTYISKADQDRMNVNKGLSKGDQYAWMNPGMKAERAYAESWIRRGEFESEKMRTLKGSDLKNPAKRVAAMRAAAKRSGKKGVTLPENRYKAPLLPEMGMTRSEAIAQSKKNKADDAKRLRKENYGR